MNKAIINTPPKQSPVEILTRQELHDTAVERVHLIAEEFTNAFNFLKKYPKSVTFFGGTHFKEDAPEYQKARSVSARISKDLNYSIVTGGGPGIMEAANRGAYENGGASIGLTIELSNHQVKNEYLTDNLDFYYFFSRKVCLSFSAEAYIFFPGGFGTLDEFYEIVTLVQTKKIEKVPIILVGSDFWKPLHILMQEQMLKRGTVDPEDLELYCIEDDEDKIVEIIKNSPVRNGIQFNHNHDHKEV
ncbi:MAG TPA: TIGR00730 family Rossman fold protein [Parcubacteria group bacterium]|jgi:uncharacterized protein (TIGR00730 family)|nr:TIGR00730 family Rossman fold protein [Parcubacteria group bacterium]